VSEPLTVDISRQRSVTDSGQLCAASPVIELTPPESGVIIDKQALR
jgi:hypothetical protein